MHKRVPFYYDNLVESVEVSAKERKQTLYTNKFLCTDTDVVHSCKSTIFFADGGGIL